uniref:Uncharacterized protein n=1 Tax=Parastrongyloides trichosuri TaxID=131310 RepID=A0A0N4ZV74_PARTI
MLRFLPCCSDTKTESLGTTIIKNKVEPEEKIKEEKESKNKEDKTIEKETIEIEANPESDTKELPTKSVRQSGEQEADQVASNQKLAYVT